MQTILRQQPNPLWAQDMIGKNMRAILCFIIVAMLLPTTMAELPWFRRWADQKLYADENFKKAYRKFTKKVKRKERRLKLAKLGLVDRKNKISHYLTTDKGLVRQLILVNKVNKAIKKKTELPDFDDVVKTIHKTKAVKAVLDEAFEKKKLGYDWEYLISKNITELDTFENYIKDGVTKKINIPTALINKWKQCQTENFEPTFTFEGKTVQTEKLVTETRTHVKTSLETAFELDKGLQQRVQTASSGKKDKLDVPAAINAAKAALTISKEHEDALENFADFLEKKAKQHNIDDTALDPFIDPIDDLIDELDDMQDYLQEWIRQSDDFGDILGQ